jgi:hypothetical protein
VCGSWGAIAGDLRYFADRSGTPRAGIEGTQIPLELIRRYATRGAPELAYDPRRKHSPLVLRQRVEYFGFELDREVESVDEFPPALADDARRILADALARGEARHPAVRRNQEIIDEIRDTYRRSGGLTPRLGLRELTDLYAKALKDVNSIEEFKDARIIIDPDSIVPAADRIRFSALPSFATVRETKVPVDYDVEDEEGKKTGVVRLRLPEKIARTLNESELPEMDRPIRFTVLRGPRGAVRANTLDELQEILERPWSPDELDEDGRDSADLSQAERHAKRIGREIREHRDRTRGKGAGGTRRGAGRGGKRGRDDEERGGKRHRGPKRPGSARPGRRERLEKKGKPGGEGGSGHNESRGQRPGKRKFRGR